MTPAASDQAIVERLRQRDEDGVRQLLRQHGGRARCALLRNFGRQKESDVDEAISEAALRVWRTIDEFDGSKSNLGAWFFLIARNALITSLRIQAAGPLIRLVDSDLLDRMQAAPSPSTADGRLEAQERLLAALEDCIGRLSSLQRDIVLSDLEAGTEVEGKVLAERWRTTPNVIWVSRNNARSNLRAWLHEKGYGG